MNLKHIIIGLTPVTLLCACGGGAANTTTTPTESNDPAVVKPVVVTEEVRHDTDDPAIWIHPDDPAKSLIIGTDKKTEGALYVFDLNGKIQEDKTVRNLRRPNNVDVAYGLVLNGQPVDIAVATERETNSLRIYRLPTMKELAPGGLPVFEGESLRAPMGISLYTRPSDRAIFAIVSRKEGPSDNYLWQYRLEYNGAGDVKATLVRKFGKFSGKKEIESIAVDNQLGYVYYSDEQFGVRKYYADPDSSGKELAVIPVTDYAEDNEGISIYPSTDTTGYLLVSDQSANQFYIYRREGKNGNPHDHALVKVVKVSTLQSDGSDVTAVPVDARFPKGLFVAMSEGKVFHYYSFADLIED